MNSTKRNDGNRFANRNRLARLIVDPRFGIGFILVLSFSVRSIDIGRGLWLDELHTSWVVADDFSDIGSRAVAGNQAPLYFWICKICVAVFGHHEWSLRLTSWLAGSCLPLLVWQILRRLTSSHLIPLSSALLVAIDPYFIRYAQEARPYALLQFFGTLQFAAFLSRFISLSEKNKLTSSTADEHSSAVEEPIAGRLGSRLGRFSFVIFGIVCFYIHYTSLILTASCFLFVLIWVAISGTKLTRKLLTLLFDFVWIGLGTLPMLIVLSGIAKRKSNWELFVNDDQFDPSIHFQLITYLLIGMVSWSMALLVRRFFSSESNSSTSSSSPSELTPPALSNSWFYGSAFLIGFAGPIFLCWFALKVDLAPLYLSRYFLIGWPNAVLFLGISLAQLRRIPLIWMRSFMVFVALIAAFSSSVWQNDLLRSMAKEEKMIMPFESAWREAIEFVNARQDGEDDGSNSIVYLFPNLIEDQMLTARGASRSKLKPKFETGSAETIGALSEFDEYCCFPLRGIYRLRIENQIPKPTLLPHRFNHVDAREMANSIKIWLIVRGNSPIVSSILNELSALQKKENILVEPIEKREFLIRGAPGNFIFVASFHVSKIKKSGN